MKKILIAIAIITFSTGFTKAAATPNYVNITLGHDSTGNTTVQADACSQTTNFIEPAATNGKGNPHIKSCTQGKAVANCTDVVVPKYCKCATSPIQPPPQILHSSTTWSCEFGQQQPVDLVTNACNACPTPSCPNGNCPTQTCTGSTCNQCTGNNCPPVCVGNNCTTSQACDLGAYGNALQSHPEGNYQASRESAGFEAVHYQLTQNLIKSNMYANFTVNLLNSNWWGNVLFGPGTTGVSGGIYSGNFTVAMPNSTATPNGVKVDWKSEYCPKCGGEEDEINANVTPEAGCTGDCPLVTASYTSSVSVDDAAYQVTNQINNWKNTYATLPIKNWGQNVVAFLTNNNSTGYLQLAVAQMKVDMAKAQNSYIMNGICSSSLDSSGTPCTDNSSAVAYTSATYGNYLITLTKSNTMNSSGKSTGAQPTWTLSVSQNMCWDAANGKILVK